MWSEKTTWLSAAEAAAISWQEVCQKLGLQDPANGLPVSKVEPRRWAVGWNEFREAQEDPLWKKYLGQFKEPLILLLLVSALVSLLMGQFDDAVVITLAIAVVATVAFVQEMRTDRALDELKKQVPATCRVVRSGLVCECDARDLVPGDVLVLTMGDRVPADARVIEAHDFAVDESSFTGETESAHKDSSVCESTSSGGLSSSSSSFSNVSYMGTFVRTGHARAVVVCTGERSQFGELYRMMHDEEPPRTPLQRNMDDLAKKLSIFSFCFIGVVFALGLYQGIPIQKIFNIAVSLAVAAIPEGLPIVVTVTLCLGIRRMAQRQALVKGLHTVETLGCVTTVCVDKTGTLTKNEMTVTILMTAAGDVCHVTSSGGHVTTNHVTGHVGGRVVIPEDADDDVQEAVTKLLETGAVCNNAIIQNGQLFGQPTEGALLAAAIKHGIHDPKEKYTILEEIPFKSETKFMAVKVKNIKTGAEEWLLKGSSDEVLRRCSHLRRHRQEMPMTPEQARRVAGAARDFGATGLRVLALARGSSLYDLCLLGLAGVLDPPRQNAAASVATLHRTGVSVLMLTGDARETAEAVAKAVGIACDSGSSLSGAELDAMPDPVLLAALASARIFYRVSPRHKLRIVKGLQERGEITCMTGDGVNDVVALRRAHIGVAMGRVGAPVSKEAADMVLNDDDFATILAAIEEGKSIFHNIGNFVQFQLSTSIVALSLIALSTLFGLPSPLNPMQILLINVIMDGPPALTLGMEPLDASIRSQPPRDTTKSLIDQSLVRDCLISATVIISGTLCVFRSEMLDGIVTARDTTMTFSCFVLFDLFNAMSCRSRTKSVWQIGITSNWYLFVAMTTTAVCLLCVVYVPVLQWVFQTQALHLSDWVYLVTLASSVLVVSEVRKWVARGGLRIFRRGRKPKISLPYFFDGSGKTESKKSIAYFGLEAV